MTRAVIYCRVSTDEQAKDERSSLDQQEEACRGYAEARGWQIVDVYREDYSAKTLDRPQLDTLRSRIRDGQYDVLIIYVVDRWVRNHLDGNILLAELRDYTTQIHFVNEQIDVNRDDGVVMLQFYFWKAQLEREDIIRRTTNGKRGLLEKGIPLNLGPDPYGYLRVKETRSWTIDAEEGTVVYMIYDRVSAGRSLNSVAKELNLSGYRTRSGAKWSQPAIRNLVQHPRYKGWTIADRVGEEHVKGKRRQVIKPESGWLVLDTTGRITPAIVDTDVWERANQQRRSRKGDHVRTADRFYLLRGRIYCAHCKQRMYSIQHSPGRQYYFCASRHNTKRAKAIGVDQDTCACPAIPVEVANAAVWQKIVETFERPEEVIERYEQEAEVGPGLQLLADRSQLTRMIADLEAREDKLRRRIVDEEDDELRAGLRSDWQQARRQKTEAEERLAVVEADLADEEAKINLVRDFLNRIRVMSTPEFWLEADDTLKYAAIYSLDVGVEVTDKYTYAVSYYGKPAGFVTELETDS